MPGSKTAPAVDGNPTYKALSFKMIDASGDERTVRIQPLRTDVDDIELEAIVSTTQALSNASISTVNVIDVYAGATLASNASTDSYQSVYDNVVLLVKNPTTQKAVNGYVPAPVSGLIGAGDVVNTSFVGYATWKSAVDGALGSGFSPVSVRFTERREKNDSTPA